MTVCIGFMFQNEADWLRLHMPVWAESGLPFVGLDGGSEDNGADVVREFGGVVYEHPYKFPPIEQHQKLMDVCTEAGYTGMIKLDPDELIFPEQLRQLADLLQTYKAVRIPTFNFMPDRFHYVPNTPWYPDNHIRAWRLDCGLRYVGGFHSILNWGDIGLVDNNDNINHTHRDIVNAPHIHLFHYGNCKDPVKRKIRALNIKRFKQGIEPLTELPPGMNLRPHFNIPFTGPQPLDPSLPHVLEFQERTGGTQKKSLETLYVICGLRRSGTGLMIDALKNAGLGKPEEWLNYKGHEMRATELIERMMEDQTEGIAGIKIFWAHIDARPCVDSANWLDSFIPKLNAQVVKYIYMHREDKVAQAVSWQRVLNGGHWQSRREPDGNVVELDYDPDDINNKIVYLQEQELRWEDYFRTRRINPLTVTYEELIADVEGTVNKVCSFIGRGQYVEGETRQKQSKGDTDGIINRYRREFGEHGFRQTDEGNPYSQYEQTQEG